MSTFAGLKFVVHAPTQRPHIAGLLPGERLRLRLREGSFARAFVRSANALFECPVEDKGNEWLLRRDLAQGANSRVPNSELRTPNSA